MLMGIETLPDTSRGNILIGGAQRERINILGELPVFRLIQKLSQFCCSRSPSWSNQQPCQCKKLVESSIAIFVLMRIKYLYDFVEANQKVELPHLRKRGAYPLRLLHVQATIKEHNSRMAQMMTQHSIKQDYAVKQQRSLNSFFISYALADCGIEVRRPVRASKLAGLI